MWPELLMPYFFCRNYSQLYLFFIASMRAKVVHVLDYASVVAASFYNTVSTKYISIAPFPFTSIFPRGVQVTLDFTNA